MDITGALHVEAGASKAAALAFRAQKLQWILSIFNHIDAKRDPRFDPKDRPGLTATPPFESGLPAGVAPEAIRDPGARAVLY